ncbi:hypothetical protein DL765_003082 [Monosporascus sp. GIB2]|nr:hypothetical protein DL765_003082 [Monosporascus sp. GIB2]
MKFVDEGPRLRSSARKASGRSSGVSSARYSGSLRATSSATTAVAEGNERAASSSPSAPTLRSRTDWGVRVRRLGSSKLDRDQILSAFVSAMFPLGSSSVQTSFLGSWLWHVPSRLGSDAALDPAALSLALAYFARLSGDQQVLRNAELSYTIALRSLLTAIADPSRRLGSEVLCAVLLLGHYETLVSGGHAWIRHAGGAARLMQLRGSRRCYESAFEYSMFLACRGAIVSEALASGEPCFLDAEEWRSIPDGLIEFPLLPSSPELYHTIFGYFAAIPGLLSKIKRVSTDTPDGLRLALLSSAETLRGDIMQWYQGYTSVDGGRRAPTLVNPPPFSEDYPFHSVYAYRDVLSATIITACFAYVILLNRHCIDYLQPDCNRAEANLGMARAICMSVDYCSRSGYCGAQTMKWALPIAYSVLPEECRGWTEAWIDKFSGTLKEVKI